jgi:V8-like Glu-specific endopeptidase
MIKFILIFLTIALTQAAFALPLPNRLLSPEMLSQINPSGNFRAANFRGIVALSNCSGSLVRFEHSQGSDKAMVMTNGHCFDARGFLKPGQVIVDQPTSRSFGLLNDDGSKFATLTADRVIVATMTKTDITLYRLTKSYDELGRGLGVRALTIASQHPVAGTPIAVVSGYWKRIYSCSVDRFIYSLHEADWTFNDSIRYSKPGCETIGGTSGSPIINPQTYEVIGINNTGNENGQRCTMNNPCEVDEKGTVTVVPHASYGQETFWLYSCLNQQNQFDIKLPSCLLRP